MRISVATVVLGLALPVAFTGAALAAGPFTFAAIEGGTLSSADWAGHPVLVVNTASMCGYAPQFAEMQKLQDTYAKAGLIVLAVPSDDFRQELGSAQEVKAYCDLNYNLTLPMTDITHVKGDEAHPFYQWVQAQTGFVPGWNFNKVLVAPDGQVVATWGAAVKPTSSAITARIDALLTQ